MILGEYLIPTLYLEVGGGDHLVVLVPGDDGDYSRPPGPQVIPGVNDFGVAHIHVGVRLKPSGQPSPAGALATRHQVSQKQPLVGVAAAKKKRGKS